MLHRGSKTKSPGTFRKRREAGSPLTGAEDCDLIGRFATSATKRGTSKKLASQLSAAAAEIDAAIAHRVQVEEAGIESLCPCRRLYGALDADLDEVKRVSKFVCHFHPPIVARLQLFAAVDPQSRLLLSMPHAGRPILLRSNLARLAGGKR